MVWVGYTVGLRVRGLGLDWGSGSGVGWLTVGFRFMVRVGVRDGFNARVRLLKMVDFG